MRRRCGEGAAHTRRGGVVERYAGRVLAERYRLPLRPGGDDGATVLRALDTYSSQEVLLRQVPLPEVVEAEFADAAPGG
ncbi:hypothetical protein, partial [Streptomyces benahoarensis]